MFHCLFHYRNSSRKIQCACIISCTYLHLSEYINIQPMHLFCIGQRIVRQVHFQAIILHVGRYNADGVRFLFLFMYLFKQHVLMTQRKIVMMVLKSYIRLTSIGCNKIYTSNICITWSKDWKPNCKDAAQCGFGSNDFSSINIILSTQRNAKLSIV